MTKRTNAKPTITYAPPQFLGQEDLNTWVVMHADGVTQDDTLQDFRAANNEPDSKVWIAGEDLTLDEAAVLAARLTEAHPERRYFVLPVKLSKPS
jgi:hypothetical protein